MKKPPFPSRDEIMALFVCDPLRGTILRKDSMTDATYKQGSGYRYVCIRRYGFLVHRILWMVAHGSEPDLIDHINRERGDNRLCNLRAATREQNAHNKKVNHTSKSGLKGVRYREDRGKWEARIRINGRNVSLGKFRTAAEAAVVYNHAAYKHRGAFAGL